MQLFILLDNNIIIVYIIYYCRYCLCNCRYYILLSDNLIIFAEPIVTIETMQKHSLERDYIKKSCQHTGNIANYHTHAGIFSYQLSDKKKVAKIIILQVTTKKIQ